MKKLIAVAALLVSAGASANPKLDCSMQVSVYGPDRTPVPGAIVQVTDTRHGWSRSRPTNEAGHTVFHGIRPDASGHQTVVVSAPGFVPQRWDNVRCALAQRVRGRINLVKEG